jgi:hypothetical protein
MAHQIQMRVDFKGAPMAITKQVFGQLKWRAHIFKALKDFDGYANAHELFHWLNTDTDEDGNTKWITAKSEKGVTKGVELPQVPMTTLRKHLSVMLANGDLIKKGDRFPIYARPGFEFPADVGDEPEEEVENGEVDETEE